MVNIGSSYSTNDQEKEMFKPSIQARRISYEVSPKPDGNLEDKFIKLADQLSQFHWSKKGQHKKKSAAQESVETYHKVQLDSALIVGNLATVPIVASIILIATLAMHTVVNMGIRFTPAFPRKYRI